MPKLKMNQYRDKALAILDSYPESEVKESLREFVHYTTSRKNSIIQPRGEFVQPVQDLNIMS